MAVECSDDDSQQYGNNRETTNLPAICCYLCIMPSEYSNGRALRALVRASLQSILKSPSAIVFSVAFPMIFILVFGFLGGSSGGTISVAAVPGADTTHPLFRVFQHSPALNWINAPDSTAANKLLREGDVTALIAVSNDSGAKPIVHITAGTAQAQRIPALQNILISVIQSLDPEIKSRTERLAEMDVEIIQLRNFKTIDFILPGQLGFSLLAAGVFGTAFVFFNLRQTLVLKRFFATPVRREVIVLSEGLARMIFQLSGAVIILSIGHFAFGYTLIHGWITFFQILLVCALALLVFMGFGFVVSSIAKNETSIPPFANLITLPQFLLAGTFFPVDAFPSWLQPICRALPLTYFNDAIRHIAFDGASFWDIRVDILVLLFWGIIVYTAAARLFKWE